MTRVDLPEVRRAFAQELRDRRWTVADLRRATGTDDQEPLDRGMVEDAVNGTRRSSIPNQARFEEVLGWESGWLELMYEGVPLRRLKLDRAEDMPEAQRLRPEVMAVLEQARDYEIEAEMLRRRVV